MEFNSSAFVHLFSAQTEVDSGGEDDTEEVKLNFQFVDSNFRPVYAWCPQCSLGGLYSDLAIGGTFVRGPDPVDVGAEPIFKIFMLGTRHMYVSEWWTWGGRQWRACALRGCPGQFSDVVDGFDVVWMVVEVPAER